MKRIKKMLAMAMLTFAVTSPSLTQAKDTNYIFGTFFTSNNDTTMQCYLSEDGIKMEHWLTMNQIKGRDISCQYYNHSFYVCLAEPVGSENTFKIYRYKDLEKWEKPLSYKVVDRGNKYRNIWAPDLFIDDDGSAYVYFAKQKGYNSKNDERTFDIYVSKIDNIENLDEISFEKAKPIQMLLTKNSGNYIDAQVRKVNGAYYMVVKNEAWLTNNDNKSPMLLKSSTPDGDFAEITKWPLRAVRGYEGFSILEKGNKVYIYADNYSGTYDNIGNSNHTVWIADKRKIETGPYKAYYVESDRTLRHGSVINVDEYVSDKLNIEEFAEVHQLVADNADTNYAVEDLKIVKLNKEDYGDPPAKGNDIVIENFAPAPGVLYSLPNNKKVIIKNIVNSYGVDKVRFSLTDGSSLRLDQIPNTTYEKNKGEDDKIIAFRL